MSEPGAVPDTDDVPLDPDVARLAASVAAGQPTPLSQVTPAELRERITAGHTWCSAGPELWSVDDTDIALPDARIGVRIYRPRPDPTGRTLVYLHGGGWVTGDLDFADEACRFLARDASCTVVSVEYRLAPEHPYPVPLEDAWHALCWAADAVAGDDVLGVAGDSAGGNLAAACALRARESGGPPLACQILIYPVLDCDFDRGSYQHRADAFPIGREAMRWFFDQYTPDAAHRDDPMVSPLRHPDLRGLPPTHVVVAGHDPLHDEGIAYAHRLAEAGVTTSVQAHAALPHGFLRYTGAVPAAQRALAELVGNVEHLFGGASRTRTRAGERT